MVDPVTEHVKTNMYKLISSQNEKVEKLLELVPAKGPEASHALCVALDNMYPHQTPEIETFPCFEPV